MTFHGLLTRYCTVIRSISSGMNDYREQILNWKVVDRNIRCAFQDDGTPTLYENAVPTEYGKVRFTVFMSYGRNIKQGDMVRFHGLQENSDVSSYSGSSSSSSSESSSQEFASWSSSSSSSSNSSSSVVELSRSSSSSSSSSSSGSSSSSSSSSSQSSSSNSSSTSQEYNSRSSSSSSSSSNSSSSST